MAVFFRLEKVSQNRIRIYMTLLRRYDLKAEECVFIDDTEENVRSADELRFAGIVYAGYEDAVKKLDKIVTF